MLPALKLLRRQFPNENITLVSEATPRGIVSAHEILGGRGIVDDFMSLDMSGGKLKRLCARLKLVQALRSRGPWALGIVLMPPYPPLTMKLVRRFRLYLRLCGVTRIIAPEAIRVASRLADGSLERLPHVIDAMLELLAPLGLPLPPQGKADAALPPQANPTPCPTLPEGHLWAIAPGSNMPAKCWPYYGELLEALRRSQNIVPIYIGGENERVLCEELNNRVPGSCVIGQPLPVVEAVMRKCEAYLGNDTGVMHLAAAVGLYCHAIFSCRDIPAVWEPYTRQKTVFRAKAMNCEGCLKTICEGRHNACLEAITVANVLEKILASSKSSSSTSPM